MTLVRFKFTFIFFSLLFSISLLTGCSSLIPSLGPGFLKTGSSPSNPGIKQMVGLMPLRNMTDYQDATILKSLESKLFDTLSKECSGTIFINPSDEFAPSFLSDPPRNKYGMIDSLDMSLMCRQFGLNMVFLASVTDIHFEKESSWYNWLIKNDDSIYLKIRVEIFDSHTGTKLFHDTFMEELDVNPQDVDTMTIPEIIKMADFDKISKNMISAITKQSCITIQTTPWKGFIVSEENGKAVISSGSNVGIKVSDVMNVYTNNGAINGYAGLKYIIPGTKVDQVRVTGVTQNKAEIISTSGQNLQADLVVQY